jgi:hypothetical protein
MFFLLGLNVFFVLPFLFPTDINSAVLNTWRYYVAAYLCIVIGAGYEFRRLRLSLQPALKTWIAVFMGALGWMVARSLIAGEPVIYIFWNGLVYLSLIVMALLGQSGTIWKTLNSLFIVHSLVGSIYILPKLLFGDIVRRESLFSMEGFNIVSSGSSVIPAALYAVPFLIFSFSKQPKLGKIAAVIGYIAISLLFLFWQSRLGTIFMVVQALILMALLWRGIHSRIFRLGRVMRPIIISGFILVLLVNLANLSGDWGDRMSYGVSLLSDRWMMEGSIIRTTEYDARIDEATIVLQQLSWDEWLAGRGVAATWQDPRIYGGEIRSMVHIGYLHYILIGGVLLFILMLFPFAWGLRALFKSSDIWTMAAGALWIQYSIMLVGYGFPSASMTWLLLGLALGKCISMNNLASSRRTPSARQVRGHLRAY